MISYFLLGKGKMPCFACLQELGLAGPQQPSCGMW